MFTGTSLRTWTLLAGLCASALVLSGCPVSVPLPLPDPNPVPAPQPDPSPNPAPTPQPQPNPDPQGEYDAGFAQGFAIDDEYFQGFFDSWDTRDGGTIFYSGGDIPFVEEPPFDAGFFDGIFFAYNDGYYVAYDYAFTIGFSEGYDRTFRNDWPAFLAGDRHTEWLDGGFTDGYEDGFSEGRIFGAFDFETGLPFDWIDALLDYRDGTDLEAGGVQTGPGGPVELYEYGTDPNELIAKDGGDDDRVKRLERSERAVPALRTPDAKSGAKQDLPASLARPLSADAQATLDQRPDSSPRSTTDVGLTTTWLERIEAFEAAIGAKRSSSVSRAALQAAQAG